MSRTSQALKRLGVAGVAAVTLAAGVPAVIGVTAANAAPGDTVVLTPEADSAAVGTCNLFTGTVRNSQGQPATSTVDVSIVERTAAGASAIETLDISFCTESTGGVTPQQAQNVNNNASNTGNDEMNAEFVVQPNGTFTFGIEGDETGQADVFAFIDDGGGTAANANNDRRDANETFDQSLKTFTAGGADAVRTVNATPDTARNFVGEQAVINVLLLNANGDAVSGVTPTADITTGPNNATGVSCAPSNNDGIARCTYTGTAAGDDTIVVFVNQSSGADGNTGNQNTTALDPTEPSDTVTRTFVAAPTGLVVDLTCGDTATARTTNEDCINPLSENTEVFTATVTAPDGTDAGTERDIAAGVVVTFEVTPDGNTANGAETVSPTEATTDANGRATTTLTDTRTTEGETVTVVARVRGQDPAAAGSSDSATKTFRTAQPGEARNIVLTPETATTTAGTFRTFSARVTNVNGEIVPNVTITFTETGAGSFRNGSSTVQSTTDANGVATVDVTSGGTETGTQTITASLPTTAGADQCEAAAVTGGARAGNCSDSSTNTFVVGGASPSPSTTTAPPSPTGSPQGPPPVPCTVPASITLDRNTITATGSAQITVRATNNSVVDVFAYSRPSTTFRVVRSIEVGGDGVASDRIVPPTNTRLFAQQRGCNASPSIVLNVRTQISLFVVRNGVRNYTFSGRLLPARPGGLIASLYRVTNDGRQILTSQTRADSSTGRYVINRRFTGSGRFGFVVRTGQDLQNAPGSSNVRSLAVF